MQPVNRRASAYAFSTLILLAAILHAYWALGGTWFLHQASGGTLAAGAPLSATVRLITWTFVAAMVAAALLTLGRVGIIWRSIPPRFFGVSVWVMTVCMLLGAALNFSIPRFWDRFVFGPIFLVLFLLTLVIALPDRRCSE
jgi:hypothetical protein